MWRKPLAALSAWLAFTSVQTIYRNLSCSYVKIIAIKVCYKHHHVAEILHCALLVFVKGDPLLITWRSYLNIILHKMVSFTISLQDIVFMPVTTACSHNICLPCLKRSFDAETFSCSACRWAPLPVTPSLQVQLDLCSPWSSHSIPQGGVTKGPCQGE